MYIYTQIGALYIAQQWPWFSVIKLIQEKKRMPSRKANQKEQNGANFSSIAPSSEELWIRRAGQNYTG